VKLTLRETVAYITTYTTAWDSTPHASTVSDIRMSVCARLSRV
jgi:hypothetical protein